MSDVTRSNLAVLEASAIPYVVRGDTCCFQEPGKPAVGFFPMTGRWRLAGPPAGVRVYAGGAAAFLAWYQKQTTAPRQPVARPVKVSQHPVAPKDAAIAKLQAANSRLARELQALQEHQAGQALMMEQMLGMLSEAQNIALFTHWQRVKAGEAKLEEFQAPVAP